MFPGFCQAGRGLRMAGPANVTRLPDTDRRAWRRAPLGAKVTLGWLSLVLLTCGATMVWVGWQPGDPESIGFWPTYVPATVVLFAPTPACLVVGVREMGWRAFGREMWLISTRRHEVFRGPKR